MTSPRGYWYPRLNRTGYDTRTPWSPAYRNPDGTDGEMLNMEFESAGAVMAYLKRAGLVAWDERTPQVSLAKGITTDEVRRFTQAWSATARQLILPDGMEITPLETSPAGPDDGMPDDDRWEWVNTATYSDRGPVWTKGACNHKTPEPVDAYPTGELVAWLCPDCGQEFDPDRWPVPEGMWRRIPVLFEDGPPGSLHKIDGQPVLRTDDGPCPHHRCDERAYTCACQTCTKCNGKEHTPWWVWTGAGIFVSLYHDLGIDVVWYSIKEWAEIAWLLWPVLAVVVWQVGIAVGWWNE